MGDAMVWVQISRWGHMYIIRRSNTALDVVVKLYSDTIPEVKDIMDGSLMMRLKSTFEWYWNQNGVMKMNMILPDPTRKLDKRGQNMWKSKRMKKFEEYIEIYPLQVCHYQHMTKVIKENQAMSRDAKSGQHGQHACAIFPPAVLIFGRCTRKTC